MALVATQLWSVQPGIQVRLLPRASVSLTDTSLPRFWLVSCSWTWSPCSSALACAVQLLKTCSNGANVHSCLAVLASRPASRSQSQRAWSSTGTCQAEHLRANHALEQLA
jgi:hypothetical protein